MDWITEDLAIGNYVDAEDDAVLRSSGIRSIICLNDHLRGVSAESRQLDSLENFNLKDGPGNDPEMFRRAVESVARAVRRYPKVLVHCHAGRSRSVIVVAAHLIRVHRWSSQEALTYVTARREAAITPGIESLLQAPFLYKSP
jgi:protein-tyrosine phosphatase